MTQRLVIGSRGSDLALYQANFIRNILVAEHSCDVVINIIKTAGDKIDNLSFDKMEGKGFFTKELEDALLAREIDLAVHSLKDLMTTQPAGLKLGAAGYRADRRELLLVRKGARTNTGLLPVKSGAVIGTSAARRKAQIAVHNRELDIRDLRGNVPTRVQKLRDGQYDAILIAAAGIQRLNLNLTDLDVIPLNPEAFLPAPAQGILGIQIRDHDPRVEAIIARLGSAEELRQAELERGLLKLFGGGCSLPLGVFSQALNDRLRLKAVLGVREQDKWVGLKRAEVVGTNVDAMLHDIFGKLQESSVCHA